MKPRNTIPPFITKFTSITNEDVSAAESFPAVGDAFIQFMQQHAKKYEDNKEVPPVENIILVGPNGKVFDIPFLIHQLSEHGIADRLFQDGRFGLGIGTLNVARKGIRNNKSGIGVPSAYNLPTLHQFVTGLLPSTWHCAMADVKATATTFRFSIFRDTRYECVFDFSEREWEIHVATRQAQVTANDSDSDSGDSQQSDGQTVSSTSSSSEDEESNTVPLGDTWDQGCDFHPTEPHSTERFQEYFTSSLPNQKWQIGLQSSPIDVNTPIRAWREVFRNTLC
jgi:DNA polymerase III epsilon subunit-like protein